MDSPTTKSIATFTDHIEDRKYISPSIFKDEARIDLRCYTEHMDPTKKGISLPLHIWVNLMCVKSNITAAMEDVGKGNKVSYEYHLGSNIYAAVNSPFVTVHIRRKFLTPDDQLVYTKKGITFRTAGWTLLKEYEDVIIRTFPEAKNMKPCYMTHNAVDDALQCKICNPNA